MTNQEMFDVLKIHHVAKELSALLVEREFRISLSRAEDFIEWLVRNGHADRVDGRLYRVVMK